MSSFPSVDNFEVGEVYTNSNGDSGVVGYTYDSGYGEDNAFQAGGAPPKTRTVSYMRNGKRISYKVDAKTGRKVAGKNAKSSPKRRSPKARKTWLPYDEGAVHDGVTSLSSKSQTDKKKLLKQAMTYFLMKRMNRDEDDEELVGEYVAPEDRNSYRKPPGTVFAENKDSRSKKKA